MEEKQIRRKDATRQGRKGKEKMRTTEERKKGKLIRNK
jgi:hypothetical protein